MSIKLILNTPDFSISGNSLKKVVDLQKKDFHGKTVKQILLNHVFLDILKGQDETVVQQAVELIFNFIQPKKIKDTQAYWNQPFESLLPKNSNEVTLDLEFSAEGLAFIKQLQK